MLEDVVNREAHNSESDEDYHDISEEMEICEFLKLAYPENRCQEHKYEES